jgi:hypothetical protein
MAESAYSLVYIVFMVDGSNFRQVSARRMAEGMMKLRFQVGEEIFANPSDKWMVLP